MKALNTAFLLMALQPLSGFAEDLPNDFVPPRVARGIEVYEFTDASITAKDVKKHDTPRGPFHTFTAVLEFKITVEGNLCTGKPEGVAVATEDLSIGDDWVSTLKLYNTEQSDAYDFTPHFCTAYGRISPIKVPVQISGMAGREGNSSYKRTFVVTLGRAQQTSEVRVLVTYDVQNGFSVTHTP